MKRLYIMVILMLAMGSAKACDICGCGVGSYYIGILPEFNKRFMGLRYQHKRLTTHLGADGSRSYLTADETYQTVELWGGWNIGSRFRVMAFVPLNYNERETIEGSGKKNGLGDIALIGYFNAMNHRTTIGNELLVQSLWVGAGAKLPTGKYEPAERLRGQDDPNNFQLGTASVDFTVNAAYDIRLMDFGINTNVSYKMNTENKHAYRYGNKFTGNMLAYYKFRIANAVTLAPNTGVLYETADKDVEQKKFDIDQSGGYSLSWVAGIETNFKRFSAGANYQNPVSQNLAGGKALAGDRVMVHIAVAF